MFEQPSIPENQKGKMETLKERGIVYFNVDLTPEEKEIIERININKDLEDFDHYGPITKELIQKLIDHLAQLENNSSEAIDVLSKVLVRVAEQAKDDLQQDAVWMTVRTSLPNHAFDIPRWHQDGHYMKLDDGSLPSEEYKLVFTLKGAPTRFAEIVDQELYEQYEQESIQNYDLYYESDRERFETEDALIRKRLEQVVKEMDAIPDGQAALYRVGGSDAKVHSEPPIKTPRIFISVVTGSASQMEEFSE